MSSFRKFGISLTLIFMAGSVFNLDAYALSCAEAISRTLKQGEKMPLVRAALQEITDVHLPSLEFVLSEPPRPRQSQNKDVVRFADLALSPHLLAMVVPKYKYEDPFHLVPSVRWDVNHPGNVTLGGLEGVNVFMVQPSTPHKRYKSTFAQGFEWQSTLDPNHIVYSMRLKLGQSDREVLLELHSEISRERDVNEHGYELGKYYSILNSLSIRLIEPNGEPLPGNLIEARLRITKILLAKLYGLRADQVGLRNGFGDGGYARYFGGPSIVQSSKLSETESFFLPFDSSFGGPTPGIVNPVTRGTRYSDAFIATLIDVISMPQAQYLSLYSQVGL